MYCIIMQSSKKELHSPQSGQGHAVSTLELFHVVNSGDGDLLLFLILRSPLYCQLVQLHGDDVMVI